MDLFDKSELLDCSEKTASAFRNMYFTYLGNKGSVHFNMPYWKLWIELNRRIAEMQFKDHN